MRALLIATVALCSVVLAACEPLGPDELQREVETVHSIAAEGSVLADQIAEQNTKRAFARVQARELSDAAEHSAERLTDAHPAEGLAGPTQEAITFATNVSSAVGELEVAPDNAAGAAATADRLRELAGQTDDLAKGL
jgi:hypothetical protein